MNENLIEIISKIKKLSIFELQNLIKELETVFNIDTTNMLMQTSSQASNNTAVEKEVEQTEFTVTLTKVPADKKIAVLKVVRTLTGLGLKESKEIVDNTPKVLKSNVSKKDAEQIKEDFNTVGAEVEIN